MTHSHAENELLLNLTMSFVEELAVELKVSNEGALSAMCAAMMLLAVRSSAKYAPGDILGELAERMSEHLKIDAALLCARHQVRVPARGYTCLDCEALRRRVTQ